jgi:hypothetical protein
MQDTSDLGLDDADAMTFYMRPTSKALLGLAFQAMLIVYVEYATLFPPIGVHYVRPRGKGAWLVYLWRLIILLPLPIRGPIALSAGVSYLVMLLLRLGRICDGRADFVFSRAGVASTGVLFHCFLPWEEMEHIERRGLWLDESPFSKRRLLAHRFTFQVRNKESIRVACRIGMLTFLGGWLRRKLVITTGTDQISAADLDMMIERFSGSSVRISHINDMEEQSPPLGR